MINMEAIRLCKLITGELVIGRQNDDNNTLDKVFTIAIRQQGNQVLPTLMPYFTPFSERDVSIDLNYVVAYIDAESEQRLEGLVDKYRELTLGFVITNTMPKER